MKKFLSLLLIFFIFLSFNNVYAESKIKAYSYGDNITFTFSSDLDSSINALQGSLVYNDNLISIDDVSATGSFSDSEYNPDTHEFVVVRKNSSDSSNGIIKINAKIKKKGKFNFSISDIKYSDGNSQNSLDTVNYSYKNKNVDVSQNDNDIESNEKKFIIAFSLVIILLIILFIFLIFNKKKVSKVLVILLTFFITSSVLAEEDYILLEKYLVHLEDKIDSKFDLNGDGSVNIIDLSIILKKGDISKNETVILNTANEKVNVTINNNKTTTKSNTDTSTNNNSNKSSTSNNTVTPSNDNNTNKHNNNTENNKPVVPDNNNENTDKPSPSNPTNPDTSVVPDEPSKPEEPVKIKTYRDTTSMYAWGELTLVSGSSADTVYNNLSLLNVDTIYQSFNKYKMTKDFLGPIISGYNEHGIMLYRLIGDSSWAYDNTSDAKVKIDEINTYNNSVSDNEEIVGVTLDVEPHANSLWKQNPSLQQEYFSKYVDNMIEYYNYAKKYNLEVAISIPVWYEKFNDFDKLFQYAADTYSLMNYSKRNNVYRISEEISSAQKYNKKVENTFNVLSDDRNESENYRPDGINKLLSDQKIVLNNYDYKYLRSSFHQYRTIIDILGGLK